MTSTTVARATAWCQQTYDAPPSSTYRIRHSYYSLYVKCPQRLMCLCFVPSWWPVWGG